MKGWNQSDLAEKLCVSLGSVGNWESGQNQPSAKTLGRIADVLGVSISFLLGEDVLPQPNVRVERASAAALQRVPVVSWATAGAGGNFSDCAEQIEEHLESDTKDANAYALIIEGDSMMPKFEPGDRVVFEPNRQAANGDIVVARVAADGHVYFKLFHTFGARAEMVRLNSFNPAFPPLEFPLKAFRFIHPMHSMLRRYRR